MSSQFNTLPSAGGLFDQDAYTLMGMMFVYDAYEEKQKWDKRRKGR